MRPTAPVTLRLLRGGAERDGARAGSRRRRWAWVGLSLVAAIAIIAASMTAGSRAARSLPDDQRIAIYERTLYELKQSCGDLPPEPLNEHCRELASFVSQFDECRGECEAIVRRHLAPNPTR